MKALKHLAGILLAAIGVMACLGAVVDALDKRSDTPWWLSAGILVVLGLLPLAGAVALLRRSATDIPPRQCPRCGGTEHAPAGLLRSARNVWMLYVGGWLLGSLWGASREPQVRCVACDALYFTETRGTRIAGILLWVVFLLVLFAALAEHWEESLP